MYANNGLKEPTLITSNIYSGSNNCEYKIIIGSGDKVNYDYMMNPNQLFAEIKCQSVQKQTVLGMIIPEGKQQSFVVLNFGAGQERVSGNSEISNLATRALYQQWRNPIVLNEMIELLGGQIVKDKSEADYNLSLDNLEKDSLSKIFLENDVTV